MIDDYTGDEPAIVQMLLMSTAHIRPEDNERLLQAAENPIDGICVDAADGGYYISILDSGMSPAIGPTLINIICCASQLNCTHVRLDRDGPIYSQLPTFDW